VEPPLDSCELVIRWGARLGESRTSAASARTELLASSSATTPSQCAASRASTLVDTRKALSDQNSPMGLAIQTATNSTYRCSRCSTVGVVKSNKRSSAPSAPDECITCQRMRVRSSAPVRN
jgi:hypothetical protein